MLDIECSTSPLRLSAPLIYRYRTGLLHTAMKAAIEAGFQDGEELSDGLTVNGGSLFDDHIPFLHWRDHQSDTKAMLSAALTLLPEKRAVIFAQRDFPLFRRPEWPAIAKACLVVDEVCATTATLPALLSYLEENSTLSNHQSKITRDRFLLYFSELIGSGEMSLNTFVHHFNELILLHVDPETGLFQGDRLALATNSQRNEISRHLTDLLDSMDGAIMPLAHALSRRYVSGDRGRSFVHDLAKRAVTALTRLSSNRVKNALIIPDSFKCSLDTHLDWRDARMVGFNPGRRCVAPEVRV